MKAGIWHQCGDRSQKLALEQILSKNGHGAVFSMRDVSFANCKKHATKYVAAGAKVCVDPQFYVPTSAVGKLNAGWGLGAFRITASRLSRLSASNVASLGKRLAELATLCQSSAIISPAVILEAGQPSLVDANARLLEAAMEAGIKAKLPVWSAIPVGHSLARSADLLDVLAQVTSVAPGGWYLLWEHTNSRLMVDPAELRSFASTSLALAGTGLPVFHANSGPHGLLSLAFGCEAVGICHSQNMWRLDRTRYAASSGGGGGNAPPRYYSNSLWGTIVFPDEYTLVSPTDRLQIHTPTPFSKQVRVTGPFVRSQLPKWDANKHLVFATGEGIASVSRIAGARNRAKKVSALLDSARSLHASVASAVGTLKDSSGSYQRPWKEVVDWALAARGSDYDYLELIS